jgi:hypothetical protein
LSSRVHTLNVPAQSGRVEGPSDGGAVSHNAGYVAAEVADTGGEPPPACQTSTSMPIVNICVRNDFRDWAKARRSWVSTYLDRGRMAGCSGDPCLGTPSSPNDRRRNRARSGRRAAHHCYPLGPFRLGLRSAPSPRAPVTSRRTGQSIENVWCHRISEARLGPPRTSLRRVTHVRRDGRWVRAWPRWGWCACRAW